MKRITLLPIIVFLYGAVYAQCDSLKTRDSLRERLSQSVSWQEKPVSQIKEQENFFYNSIYNPVSYPGIYNHYQGIETNSASKTVLGGLGNILLSILAGKTNHQYRSAPF